MSITLDIPDGLAPQFTRPGQDLARMVVEDAGRGSVPHAPAHWLPATALARGLATHYELDGLLKARRIRLGYTLEDLKRDRETHRKLGL